MKAKKNFLIKPIISAVLSASCLFMTVAATNPQSYTDDNGNTYEYNLTVLLDNEPVSFSNVHAPVIYNNNTLIPMRVLFEAIGAKVAWNELEQSITATKDGTTVKMTIDSTEMYVNGNIVSLDVPPTLMQYDDYSDTTMIPLRAVAESFDCDIMWDSSSNTVNILNKVLENPTATPASPVETTSPTSTPQNNTSSPIQEQSRIAIDNDNIVYIKNDNTVWQGSINNNNQTQVEGLKNIIAVANGRTAYYALSADGYVYSWGNSNEYGQLARNGEISKPEKISGLENIKKIDAGISFGVALSENGKLYTWGRNNKGQLGTGNTNQSETPFEVNISGIKDVSCGAGHVVAVINSGTVYTWGENSEGQLGRGSETTKYSSEPGAIKTMYNINSVYAGPTSSCAIRNDKSIYMWGTTYLGELGNGELPLLFDNEDEIIVDEDGYFRYPKPNRMAYYYYDYTDKEENTGVLLSSETVSCGDYQTAAICNGKLYMWGDSPVLRTNFKSQIQRFCAQEYSNIENPIAVYATSDKTIYVLDKNETLWKVLYNDKQEVLSVK